MQKPNQMNRTYLFLLLFFFLNQLTTAQNFTGGFNFNLPYDDSTTVEFLPQFPKKAIDETGFVSTDNSGNFIVNGKPIRFFGGNLTAQAAFPTKNDAVKIAGRMRKMGINLIRFHHIDNPWSDGSLFYGVNGTRNFNTALLDRLDYLIYQLKLNGIYVNMNLNVSRTFEKSDGIEAADSLSDYGKGVTLYNRKMIELEKEYAQKLLGHLNPYTGIPLAQDPVLAMVEIVNENSLFRRWYGEDLRPISEGGSLPTVYSNELDSLWLDFLAEKYDSTQNVADAWNQGIKTGAIIFSDDFENGLNTQIWQMERHEGAQATYELDVDTQGGNSSVLVKTIQNGSLSWHITFKNVGNSIVKDSTYELTFRAKADEATALSAGFQRNNSPWTYYMGTTVMLSTEYQTFKVVFRSPENNTGNLRIFFRFDFHIGEFNIDDVVFKEVSTSGLDENESLEARNIRRLPISEINGYSPVRTYDLTEFYTQTQINFLKEMKVWLKDSVGVNVPLAGTNWYVGPEDVYVQNTLDYLDNHNYWDHPQFPNQPWSSTDWRINNIPMMTGSSSTIENLFNGLMVKDKPYTVSEYNHGYPNQFQAEMLPITTSYLSYNSADAIMYFTYSGTWNWSTDRLDGYFDLHRNHAVMSGFPIFSYVFRNNLIKEAENSVIVNYRKSDIMNMPFEVENSWGTHTPFPNQLSYTHKVELTFNEDLPSDVSQVPNPSASPYSTQNDEIYWNKNGLFKINTIKFNCIAGQLDQNKGASTNQMELVSGSDFASISWLSLADSALSESSKSILYVGSTQINTGMIWDGIISVHNNWGYNPTMIKPQNISVKLKNNSAGLKVTPMDNKGNQVASKSKYFVTDENGYSLVSMNTGEDRTIWYAVETISDWSLTKSSDFDINSNPFIIYPNPSTDVIHFKHSTLNAGNFELEIFDLTGKLLFSEKSKSEYAVKKDDVGGGMFIFKAYSNGEVSMGKIIFY